MNDSLLGVDASMGAIVGIFEQQSLAVETRDLLSDAGYQNAEIQVFGSPGASSSTILPVSSTYLKHRSEEILRTAVLWGLVGSIIVEIPSVLALLMLPIDVNVRVLMAATVWKAGAGFGAWFGAMVGNERGLDSEVAKRYTGYLREGYWLLVARVPLRGRPHARGAMIENGAINVEDIEGSLLLRKHVKVLQLVGR